MSGVARFVKVWELPVETLLSAGLGTLPLAPISAVAERDLPGVIAAMKRRVDVEPPAAIAGEFWTATRILMGLRYDGQVISNLLRGVQDMKESVTYQAILKEGEEKGYERGRAREVRALLIRVAAPRIGTPDDATRSRLEAIDDVSRLEALFDRVIVNSAQNWSELLGS